MKPLFSFHETLEFVNNVIPELVGNATDAQRVIQKDEKKKDCKVVYYIQFAVTTTTFDQISHAESENGE